MAIKAAHVTGTVAAGETGNFMSPQILTRHRPVAALFWISVSATGSRFSIFLTKSETPVDQPQPGDPPVFDLMGMQTFGTNLVVIPLAVQTFIDPPVKFALSVYNAATEEAIVSATYVYEE